MEDLIDPEYHDKHPTRRAALHGRLANTRNRHRPAYRVVAAVTADDFFKPPSIWWPFIATLLIIIAWRLTVGY